MSRQRGDPCRPATGSAHSKHDQVAGAQPGAGVQSTTLAPMAAHGIIDPMPDYAVCADTGWKPTVV